MAFFSFELETFLSQHEEGVELDFANTGTSAMNLGEVMELLELDAEYVRGTSLAYPAANGALRLRELVASLYRGADADNVLITVGATEANLIAANTLLAPGDRMIAFVPTYKQVIGNALNRGASVDLVGLDERSWSIDAEKLESMTKKGMTAIHIVNPNNPTGHVLGVGERLALVRAAEQAGAWIIAEEVYAGTEWDLSTAAPSFWEMGYDRVVVVNSMSKAYGLPGIRLGWIVAPHGIVNDLRRRHEYAAISATALGSMLAAAALRPACRAKLLERNRHVGRLGFEALENELGRYKEIFSVVRPQAGVMGFVKYDLPVDSWTLATRLAKEQGVLVVPGACFGLEGYVRFGVGSSAPRIREGIVRLGSFAAAMREGRMTHARA